MLKRTKLAITGAVAVGAIAAAGIAYAAFGYSPVANANGSAEQFEATTVTVTTTPSMIPGEKKNVVLKLTNPNSNLNAKVVSIEAVGLTDVMTNDPGDAGQCTAWVIQNVSNAGNVALPITIGAGDTNYTLIEGIAFHDDMDIRCEGMSFKSNWKVTFQAVRS